MNTLTYANQPRLLPVILRTFSAVLLAMVITFTLFALMKLLITPAVERLQRVAPDLPVVALYEPPKETPTELRKPLPPKPELAPVTMKLNYADPVETFNQLLVGQITPDLSVALQGPAIQKNMRTGMATPLVRVEPRFPTEAARQGLSGWVLLNFSIDETGSVTDISILAAEPKNIFEREAVRALRRWKYQPQLVEGKPIKQTNLQVQLDFQLQQE